jgi:hypothetical protein
LSLLVSRREKDTTVLNALQPLQWLQVVPLAKVADVVVEVPLPARHVDAEGQELVLAVHHRRQLLQAIVMTATRVKKPSMSRWSL